MSLVLHLVSEMGYQSALLAGGEKLNSAFLKEKLINEICIIVKPFVIGYGKSLFNIDGIIQKATLSHVEKLEDNTLELTYQII